tara:strand:+ start:5718 stop:6080 length:363 start_codon:yes stop_codon:yes gene_type:complete
MYKQIVTIAIIMLVLDIVYLKLVTGHFNDLMNKIQGKPITIKYLPAALCYTIMVFAMYHFVVKENKSLLDAFLLGFVIYGVYDTTNMATIDEWNWFTVILDTFWGATLFTLTYYFTKKLI